MRRFFVSSVLTLLAAIVPATVFAAPPANVTGLEADIEEGNIVVRWDKVEEDDIAYYRIYHSAKSILANAGDWDDFEQTEDDKGKFVFETNPVGDQVYIGVLAVNQGGEESTGFVEEISVNIPKAMGGEASSSSEKAMSSESSSSSAAQVSSAASSAAVSSVSSAASSSQAPTANGSLQLISAQAVSPTEVELMFSHTITIDENEAPKAFSILDAAGNKLAIRRLIVTGKTSTVETAEQEQGKVYNVVLSEPLMGVGGLPLDDASRTKFFQGHKNGKAQSSSAAPVVPTGPVEVADARLTTQPFADGTYGVRIEWPAPQPPNAVSAYVVAQTLDGGHTFGPPEKLPPTTLGVDIPGVQRGSFGLAIHTMDRQGQLSPGVLIVTDLPATQPALFTRLDGQVYVQPQAPTPTATVVPQQPTTPVYVPPTNDYRQPVHSPNLPQSGTTFVLLSTVVLGALIGWHRGRKSTKFAA